MPTYEYQCSLCGQHVEAFQKMSDQPLTECPHCHKPTLNKQLSPAGFQLKGSGWYVTDYKDKNKPKATDTTADKNSEPAKPKESAETSADSKKDSSSTSGNSSSGTAS